MLAQELVDVGQSMMLTESSGTCQSLSCVTLCCWTQDEIRQRLETSSLAFNGSGVLVVRYMDSFSGDKLSSLRGSVSPGGPAATQFQELPAGLVFCLIESIAE